MSVSHIKTFIHHSPESALTESGIKTIQVFTAHLVNDNANYQFGIPATVLAIPGRNEDTQQYPQYYTSHTF
jgi:hypothetical protein